MLGRKKSNSNDDWKRAFDASDKLIPFDKALEIVLKSADKLKKDVRGRTAVCCWSGGKDAQVLRLVCEIVGIQTFTMGNGGELEYPAFQSWVEKHKPTGLEIYDAGIDLSIFERRPNLIFPTTAADAYWYYQNINQQAWRKAAARHNADCIILGHRKLDGNQKGKPWEVDGRPLEKLFPIWDMTHEEVLAVIKHFNLALAPFYEWPNGFIEGTHTVLARSGKDGKQKAADIIKSIDAGILPRLAERIPHLAQYL